MACWVLSHNSGQQGRTGSITLYGFAVGWSPALHLVLVQRPSKGFLTEGLEGAWGQGGEGECVDGKREKNRKTDRHRQIARGKKKKKKNRKKEN